MAFGHAIPVSTDGHGYCNFIICHATLLKPIGDGFMGDCNAKNCIQSSMNLVPNRFIHLLIIRLSFIRDLNKYLVTVKGIIGFETNSLKMGNTTKILIIYNY
jgi:hypothetical protein